MVAIKGSCTLSVIILIASVKFETCRGDSANSRYSILYNGFLSTKGFFPAFKQVDTIILHRAPIMCHLRRLEHVIQLEHDPSNPSNFNAGMSNRSEIPRHAPCNYVPGTYKMNVCRVRCHERSVLAGTSIQAHLASGRKSMLPPPTRQRRPHAIQAAPGRLE